MRDNEDSVRPILYGANASVPDMDPIKYHEIQAIFMIFYTVIFVLGIFGNALTCYVVCRNRAMQTVTNFFITNLALSDILLCVLCVPFTPLYTFLESWIFGKTLCYILAPATSISVYISTVTLTSIAIDRFFVIVYPFRRRMKTKTCLTIVLGSWMFSILATLPYGYHVAYMISYETNQSNANETSVTAYYCEEAWPGNHIRKIYGCITVTMQFIIPFSIIAFCYTKVSLKLNERAKPGTKNSRKEEIDRERKKRTNRMLIAMVSIFALSWLPLNCINIINDFNNQVGNWKYYNLLFFFFHALAMSSTCYNPFLYAWLNENFRKEFKQVLPGLDSCRQKAAKDRIARWRSDQTCTGNETETTFCQSASIVRRCSSVRMPLPEGMRAPEKPNEIIELENLFVSKGTQNSKKERKTHSPVDDTVLLHNQSSSSTSSPPITDGLLTIIDENHASKSSQRKQLLGCPVVKKKAQEIGSAEAGSSDVDEALTPSPPAWDPGDGMGHSGMSRLELAEYPGGAG